MYSSLFSVETYISPPFGFKSTDVFSPNYSTSIVKVYPITSSSGTSPS
jgi:hypothetical protein